MTENTNKDIRATPIPPRAQVKLEDELASYIVVVGDPDDKTYTVKPFDNGGYRTIRALARLWPRYTEAQVARIIEKRWGKLYHATAKVSERSTVRRTMVKEVIALKAHSSRLDARLNALEDALRNDPNVNNFYAVSTDMADVFNYLTRTDANWRMKL